MTEPNLDPDFLSWPRRAPDGNYAPLAAEHGARVATILVTNNWADANAKSKWKAHQLSIMQDLANDLVRAGNIKRPAADAMLSAYRKAVAAKLLNPDGDAA